MRCVEPLHPAAADGELLAIPKPAGGPDGKVIRAYNLSYPAPNVLRDALIMQYALNYQPDLIVWPITLESFPRTKQLFPAIVQNNASGFGLTANFSKNGCSSVQKTSKPF